MKRNFIIALLAMIGAAIALGTASGPARADSGTDFTATYMQGQFWFDCEGTRTMPTSTTAHDDEVCFVAATGDDSLTPGTYSGDPNGDFPPFGDNFGWASDYDGMVADSWTAVVNNTEDEEVWEVDISADYTLAPVITPQNMPQDDHVAVCASQPVLRGDGTVGTYLDISDGYQGLGHWTAYDGTDVTFTFAFAVQGVGTTCSVPAGYHAAGYNVSNVIGGAGIVDEAAPQFNIYPFYVPNA